MEDNKLTEDAIKALKDQGIDVKGIESLEGQQLVDRVKNDQKFKTLLKKAVDLAN